MPKSGSYVWNSFIYLILPYLGHKFTLSELNLNPIDSVVSEQIGCDRQTDRQATEFSVLCLYKSQGTRINNE